MHGICAMKVFEIKKMKREGNYRHTYIVPGKMGEALHNG